MATTIRTSTVTLNAAFLNDVKELNRALHGRLEDLFQICQQPIAWGKHREVVDSLAQLRDDLAMHFSIEESLGYFTDPLECAPWLCDEAAKLLSQHDRLYREIGRLVDNADALSRSEAWLEFEKSIPRQFISFYHRLQKHESAEVDLIMDALYLDIGVGD